MRVILALILAALIVLFVTPALHGQTAEDLDRELRKAAPLESTVDPLRFMKEVSCIIAIEVGRDEEKLQITVQFVRPPTTHPVHGGPMIPDAPEVLVCTLFIPETK